MIWLTLWSTAKPTMVPRHWCIRWKAGSEVEDYWTISWEYVSDDVDERSGKLSCRFHWVRGHVYDKYVCAGLYETCLDVGVDGLAMVPKGVTR
jgi:hypothetical protein